MKRLHPRGDSERVEEALAVHRAAKFDLCNAIRKFKAKCWDELLGSLNTDPWGHPYKIVIKSHRS